MANQIKLSYSITTGFEAPTAFTKALADRIYCLAPRPAGGPSCPAALDYGELDQLGDGLQIASKTVTKPNAFEIVVDITLDWTPSMGFDTNFPSDEEKKFALREFYGGYLSVGLPARVLALEPELLP